MEKLKGETKMQVWRKTRKLLKQGPRKVEVAGH